MTSMQLDKSDVTGTIDVSNPDDVRISVLGILQKRYRNIDFGCIETLFVDFARLYRGEYPGFHACDTQYHDMQHVLDVTLATVRLIDGYDASQSKADQLGGQLAIIGVAIGLFHDSGYIRRKGDTRHQFGAEYTKIHVTRSARFIAEYLPSIGMQWAADTAATLVHYTGYEFDPATLDLPDPKLRQLGALIGSADVMAQMADRNYLQKCRDRLFREFELGGITRGRDANGVEFVRYASADDLLQQTPEFIRHTLVDRLGTLFGGAYRYFDAHFDGKNLYAEAIERNRLQLERMLQQHD